ARDQQLVFELRDLSRICQAVPSRRNELNLEPLEGLKEISSRPVRGGCFLGATPKGHVRPKPVRPMHRTVDHPARRPVLYKCRRGSCRLTGNSEVEVRTDGLRSWPVRGPPKHQWSRLCPARRSAALTARLRRPCSTALKRGRTLRFIDSHM